MGKCALLWVNLLALLRRRGVCLLLAALSAGGVFAVVSLSGLEARQVAALAEMETSTVISCVVTDGKGMNMENLNMISAMVDMLTGRRLESGCTLGEYVKDVRARATVPLTSPEDFTLRRILTLDSDPALEAVNGASVTFYPGWDESVLDTEALVCLVPADSLALWPEGKVTMTAEITGVAAELEIIGTVSGGPGNVFYCPFYAKWQAEITEAFPVDACSFAIGDNARLDECKAEIYRYFSQPSLTQPDPYLPFGVLVQDEVYLSTRQEILENLRLLRLLLPLLMGLMGCVGFFGAYLSAKGRRREFAVMRCLGMKRRQVFVLAFAQQAMLTIPGGLIGLGLAMALEGGVPALGRAALVCGVILLGAALAALGVTRVNVIKLMKAEE